MIRSLLFASAFIAGTLTVSAQTEKFIAVINAGTPEEAINASLLATTESDNNMISEFSTANLTGKMVAGKTIKTITQDATVTEWNDVNTTIVTRANVNFYYVNSTGNPYVSYGAEEVVSSSNEVSYRPTYVLYSPENKELPKSGLYYTLTPKKNGTLKIGVWVNKGNRETFLVKESTKEPIDYTAEGYVNGQNNEDGTMKFLSNDDLLTLHANSASAAKYTIGQGNQPFWGWITATVEANETYYLFVSSAQIGFQGYEFTPEGTTGIAKTSAVAEDEAIYTINGIQTNNLESGKIYIKDGKKFIAK